MATTTPSTSTSADVPSDFKDMTPIEAMKKCGFDNKEVAKFDPFLKSALNQQRDIITEMWQKELEKVRTVLVDQTNRHREVEDTTQKVTNIFIVEKAKAAEKKKKDRSLVAFMKEQLANEEKAAKGEAEVAKAVIADLKERFAELEKSKGAKAMKALRVLHEIEMETRMQKEEKLQVDLEDVLDRNTALADELKKLKEKTVLVEVGEFTVVEEKGEPDLRASSAEV